MSSIKIAEFENNFSNLTLSQIVTKNFKTAAIFEKYNLDFCCRGNKSINEACTEKGVDSTRLLQEVQQLLESKSSSTLNSNDWELDFLIDYIMNTHHNYVRSIIPILSAHVNKVSKVHGENHPELIEIAKIFSVVSKELKHHLMKEEEILFPYIKKLVIIKNNNHLFEAPYFGTIKNPINMMEAEHVNAGDGMYNIRKLSKNYEVPEDACNTYRVCLNELREFEEDLHQHVHLENNILFPKAIAMEEILSKNV